MSAAAILLIGSSGLWYWHNTNHVPAPLTSKSVDTPAQKDGNPLTDKPASVAEQPKQSTVVQRTTQLGLNGRTMICFTFPPGSDFGVFDDASFPVIDEERHKAAEGTVNWPADVHPGFRPSALFLGNPDNLSVFHADDLSALQLQDCRSDQWRPEILKRVARLTGLKGLDLEGTEVKIGDLGLLSTLPNLQNLGLNYTNIDGAEYAKSPLIHRLHTINFCQCQHASALVTALRGSRKLSRLYLDGNTLTPSDFKSIGTMDHLTLLQVRDTGVTPSDLMQLLPLKKLEKLDARDSNITPEAIAPLTAMKRNALKSVLLYDTGWTDEQQARMKSALPGVKFSKPGVLDNKGSFSKFLKNQNMTKKDAEEIVVPQLRKD